MLEELGAGVVVVVVVDAGVVVVVVDGSVVVVVLVVLLIVVELVPWVFPGSPSGLAYPEPLSMSSSSPSSSSSLGLLLPLPLPSMEENASLRRLELVFGFSRPMRSLSPLLPPKEALSLK